MAYRTLTDAQVTHFIERGYVHLPEAFPHDRALAAQDYLWERLAERGVCRDDPGSWAEPMVHMKEAFRDPVFDVCMTERLADAVEDLVGPGRWARRGERDGWGWWPVNFAVGADRPWDVPTGGWHWDGIHFRHFVNSPEQGILLLCMFSEIGPHGGGTLVAEGSHEVVTRFLAARPEGRDLVEAIGECNRSHPWLAALTGADRSDAGAGDPYAKREEPDAAADEDRIERFMQQDYVDEHGTRLRVVETRARPGDVYLCHPFLYHAASQNPARIPRFMCNRTTPLCESMQLERADGAYSPVEISLRRALGRA